MRSSSLALAAFGALAALVACGARTPLEGPGAANGGASPDGGVVLPDGAVVAAKTCPAWVATHAPVQVSSLPSIVELMAAVPTPAGVLAGYADAQLPPVDSSWHARLVAFGDGALGAEATVFPRDSSQPAWTRISFAQGVGRAAAVASDQVNGMLFVPVDGQGAPAGAPVSDPGDAARFLLATPDGYTVLRSGFDPFGTGVPGPVSLATLDASGHVTGERPLLDEPAGSVFSYARAAFADGSFLLSWFGQGTCPGCRAALARHFTAGGDALAPQVTLHAFDPQDYGDLQLAAGTNGLLVVRSVGSAGPVSLVGEPFDANGQPAGAGSTFTTLPGPNTPAIALAAAPGGRLPRRVGRRHRQRRGARHRAVRRSRRHRRGSARQPGRGRSPVGGGGPARRRLGGRPFGHGPLRERRRRLRHRGVRDPPAVRVVEI